MKQWANIFISYITVICFLVYSVGTPTLAYAQSQELPASSFDQTICTNITTAPNLELTMPNLSSCDDCFAWVVSPTGKVRVYDEKGNAMQVSGLLLNETASANLAAELSLMQRSWMAQYERILGHNTACMQRQYSILDSRYQSLQVIYEAQQVETQRIMTIKNDQIDKLSDRPFWKSTEFGVIIGVVLGIGITIGTGYALGQIDE